MSRIINICGTSGSGKSTLVRNLISQATFNQAVRDEGRKSPIGYQLGFPWKEKTLHLLGAYESPTGGCDTIKDIERVFDLVRYYSEQEIDTVYEGLFVMNMTRGPQLCGRLTRAGHAYHVLQLTTPLDECIASINARRAAKGEGPLENRKNTEQNHTRAKNYAQCMKDAGAVRHRVTREEALPKLLEILTCQSRPT